MSDTMQVLVYDGPHAFHIEERPLPDPSEGEVRIRTAYVGICGSDLHGYTGESGRRHSGMVMGHEASGYIDAVGPGVDGLASGDAVTFNPSLPCDGSCGHRVDNHCVRLRVIGVTPDIQGAFAEWIVVPASRVVPLGGLDLFSGAAVEPMAVALQATMRAGIRDSDAVLVIGGGMIGQCIARTARLAGATSVTVSEGLVERSRLAEAAGFDTVAPDEVKDLDPVDIAFDAVGISATAAAALRSVVKGGTVCCVGLGLPEISIPLFDLVVPERTMIGSFTYTDSVFIETVRHLHSGELDVSTLIGATVPIEGVASAFEELATGARADVKIMMKTDSHTRQEV
jgi:2-desacetyl-2-hydroxyethyl bacteriochlorophyllide A dehydrogenase